MWQRLERKIYFLNCLFVYFILLFFLPSTFLVFFFLLFLLSAFFFHPHFSIRIFPSASAIRRYPVRVLQTPEAERVYALLIHHHFCYSSVNIKRVYFWGRMLPCAPTVGWFVITGLPRLKEFLSLLNFTMSSTFLCKKKRSWHKNRIVSFAPLIRDT